jgi:hypothetical protein
MSVGDRQFDPTQATAGELPQERCPEGLGFGYTDVSNPTLLEIINDFRNPAAPLRCPMKSARSGGLAPHSYTTMGDTIKGHVGIRPEQFREAAPSS